MISCNIAHNWWLQQVDVDMERVYSISKSTFCFFYLKYSPFATMMVKLGDVDFWDTAYVSHVTDLSVLQLNQV